MKVVSRRNFIKGVAVMGATITVGILAGCGGAGGSAGGNSTVTDDVDGILIESASFGRWIASNGNGFATINLKVKNVKTDEECSIDKITFALNVGDGSTHVGATQLAIMEPSKDLVINGPDYTGYPTDSVTLKPGEEKMIEADFALTQVEYNFITVNYTAVVTFYNGSKQQKISIKDKVVTVGKVERR